MVQYYQPQTAFSVTTMELRSSTVTHIAPKLSVQSYSLGHDGHLYYDSGTITVEPELEEKTYKNVHNATELLCMWVYCHVDPPIWYKTKLNELVTRVNDGRLYLTCLNHDFTHSTWCANWFTLCYEDIRSLRKAFYMSMRIADVKGWRGARWADQIKAKLEWVYADLTGKLQELLPAATMRSERFLLLPERMAPVVKSFPPDNPSLPDTDVDGNFINLWRPVDDSLIE